MQPPRLVNDFAAFLTAGDTQVLENKLLTFNNETSTQMYIVIVEDLGGNDPSDYASRLGEKWGIGQQGKDNGILILVKPKTSESKGEVFIATGYGLEAVVPDAVANRIVDQEIIPEFKSGNYAAGLNKATDILMALTRGEFTAEEYVASSESSGIPGLIGFLVLLVIIGSVIGGRSGMNRHNGLGKSIPFWILLSMMNSGSRSHGGSFGNFTGGRGGFGGGGFGGFGGGGGGSFGGGGAGGSW